MIDHEQCRVRQRRSDVLEMSELPKRITLAVRKQYRLGLHRGFHVREVSEEVVMRKERALRILLERTESDDRSDRATSPGTVHRL